MPLVIHAVLVRKTTADLGKVLNCMSDVRIEAECNFSASVQIGGLALKHRQNKNQRQRIVIFVGSPISDDKVGCCMDCMGSTTSFVARM